MPSDTLVFTRWNGGDVCKLFFDEIDCNGDCFISGCFGCVSNENYAESIGFKIIKSSIVNNGSEMH